MAFLGSVALQQSQAMHADALQHVTILGSVRLAGFVARICGVCRVTFHVGV